MTTHDDGHVIVHPAEGDPQPLTEDEARQEIERLASTPIESGPRDSGFLPDPTPTAPPAPKRTQQERHRDIAFTNGLDAARRSHSESLESIDWMATMGEVPAKFRNMPVLLGQWIDWIEDQRRIKQ